VANVHLTVLQAIEGYMLEKRLVFSPATVENYTWAFGRFVDYLDGDPPLEEIGARDVNQFLLSLQNSLSQTSLLNIHSALASLWTWALREGYADTHVIRQVEAPAPEGRAVVPFSRADVAALLSACERSREYRRQGQKACANARPTAARDRAIVLLLLDTGIRVSELCALRIKDIDLGNGRIKVFGKGARERLLPIGTRTRKALWRYLAGRPDARPADPLFVADGTVMRRLDRWAVYKLVRRLGERAGIQPDAHPHRFRHTFAISFLRNGGDVYSLKGMLGHSTLKMVQRYLTLAQTDLENAHRRASPVDNWRL